MGLSEQVGFEFNVNYHSNGRWLLYPEGWQTSSPTADDPIYYALSGNLDKPAIEGFHPGLSSDVLYVTNGEANDFLHKQGGALAWTPELSPGCPSCGFVFPDDPALVQEEFERNLPFADSVANSAADPDDPKSSLGIKTKPFYLKSDDPYKDGLPGSNFTFKYSYGDPQPVQVLAKRALGAVTAKYKINGGATRSASTSEWKGGEKYKPASVHYHVMRGTITGTKPGDKVEVWFEGGGQKSPSFTYDMVSDSNRQMLVVAAEDYSGASNSAPGGPKYTQTFLEALAQNGVQADVYDVDARTRTAPDALGVLSHYKGVIWYTGDDVVTREADGRAGGNADRLALRRDARDARLHGRGRPRRLLGQDRRHAVHGRRRRHPVLRPEGRGRLPDRRRGEPGARLAPVPAAARLGVRRRPDQRRAAVLVRRHGPDRRRRPERDHPVRPQRHREPVRRVSRGR